MNRFIETITTDDRLRRDQPFFALAQGMSTAELLNACAELEEFRRDTNNLYARVRAALFLAAAYRFFVMEAPEVAPTGVIPYEGYRDLLARRYEHALVRFHAAVRQHGLDSALASALAEAYRHLAFQSLADQVRKSVRATRGNRWLFHQGYADEHPLRIHASMLVRQPGIQLYPILAEFTPVRLDLSHSGWSDIFFLGMDYPSGARVCNISIDLGIEGRDAEAQPPVQAYVRVLPEPLLRLTSLDLKVSKDVTDLCELFNFGNDYLGLLKAGVIASGLIPPAFEGVGQNIAHIFAQVIGPGMGLELVTCVRDIPKGSRLAVSTNLLASIISALMRVTGQTASLEGPLNEVERRLVASRAILGEWLGGSGGGWQDSGGIWPGVKVIEGAIAQPGDAEFGVSAGCLLPRHHILGPNEMHAEFAERLTASLVLVHGGLAQNVGPILEMVTEKYLLRNAREWQARAAMRMIFDDILQTVHTGDIRRLAQLTTANWDGPLKAIIPWVTNDFTESVIRRARARYGADYWGFLMLGGMSGGGMGFFANPIHCPAFRDDLLEMMHESKEQLQHALPFSIDPVVYRFRINSVGTSASLLAGADALMPSLYYAHHAPLLVRQDPQSIPYLRRIEMDHFIERETTPQEAAMLLRTVVRNLFRISHGAADIDVEAWDRECEQIKHGYGFDAIQHEQLRADLRSGRIGLARNRLPVNTEVTDVNDDDVAPWQHATALRARGEQALRDGAVAILTLAAGIGSRWTTGAGVIKALNPFVEFDGRHRNFLEVHLAKTEKTMREYAVTIPHLISTSFLTHEPIAAGVKALATEYTAPIILSEGRSIAQRMIPMTRDLVFLWEETPQEMLDVQKQKVRDATRCALLEWARTAGEGTDYGDNLPVQRLNPPGHWYEVSNLLRNGVLARLLRDHPQLRTLMLHNIDTLGADIDPAALGFHLASGATLSYEVVPRRIGDYGGGLARVNGRLRLLEGLAQPREEESLRLRYYNSLTTWIDIDALLALFHLSRADLDGPRDLIDEAVRRVARRIPTYVTIKDVKRRWGYGHEDIFPVCQFEKLWGDMTALPDVNCAYLAVPRFRGQQLKEPAQLDAWANDGSKEHIAKLCHFAER